MGKSGLRELLRVIRADLHRYGGASGWRGFLHGYHYYGFRDPVVPRRQIPAIQTMATSAVLFCFVAPPSDVNPLRY